MKKHVNIRIATHDGAHHPDDVFSVVILRKILEHSGNHVEVIRTRDNALLAASDYCVDVGGVYDPHSGCYDHHQIGAMARPVGQYMDHGFDASQTAVTYSSAGLLWKDKGLDYLSVLFPDEPKSVLQEAWGMIDREFIYKMDLLDNRYLQDSVYDSVFSIILSDSKNGQPGAFDESCVFCKMILEQLAHSAVHEFREKMVFQDALQCAIASESDTMVLTRDMNPLVLSKMTIDEDCPVSFLVHPSGNGKVMLRCLYEHDNFGHKKDNPRYIFPEQFRGESEDIFIHKKGHCASISKHVDVKSLQGYCVFHDDIISFKQPKGYCVFHDDIISFKQPKK